jgi:hypothetical protein
MTVPPMGLRGGRNTVRLNRPLFALALFILPTAAAQPADPSAPLCSDTRRFRRTRRQWRSTTEAAFTRFRRKAVPRCR